jgi:hypothetical protein
MWLSCTPLEVQKVGGVRDSHADYVTYQRRYDYSREGQKGGRLTYCMLLLALLVAGEGLRVLEAGYVGASFSLSWIIETPNLITFHLIDTDKH